MRRDTVDNLFSMLLARVVLVTGLIALSINSIPQVSANPPSVRSGFPDDFVTLYTQKHGSFRDTGGKGEGQILGGFGGLKDKTRAENKAALEHTPVILLHGNGVHALHTEGKQGFFYVPTLGVWPIRDFLLKLSDYFEDESDYNDAEIWAISYLGSNPPPSEAELGPMVQNNLPDVRNFIDTVIEYLDVDKVDIIAHSLGNNMAKGYMNGFQIDNSWDNSKHRLDKIGTYVSLAAGHYGVPPAFYFKPSDTDPGSVFESGAHTFNSITDDTPYGALTSKQTSDNADWIQQTSLDEEAANGSHDLIYYVAIRSHEDFVDEKIDDSSRLVGAHLNHEFDLTKPKVPEPDYLNLVEHSRIVTDDKVFKMYAPCLNGGGPSCPQEVIITPRTCHTTTNDQHVASERAVKKTVFFFFTSYHAIGSDDNLGGDGDDTTSLKETRKTYWEKVDRCPE